MEVDYLISFKNSLSCQNLDDDQFKHMSALLKLNKYKKKKNNTKEPKKLSTVVKEKIQISKDKIENRISLLINKLDSTNIDKIIEEFINKFKDIEESEFLIFQKEIYKRIIKDSKFQDIFLDFFIKIKKIYNLINNFNENYFISLIEYKFKYDYTNLKDKANYILDDINILDSEDNRINNLLLIIRFIEYGYFDVKILDEISKILLSSNHIPDIYKFMNNKYINSIYNFDEYYSILYSKVNDNMSSRYSVLLNSILENFNNKDFQICTEDSCEESIITPVVNEDQFKTPLEIEIENILEEYLLIEDFEEINNYLETNNNKDFFKYLIDFYFKNNLNNFDKFKSLFLNFRNTEYVKSNIIINSLVVILKSDNMLDYVNIQTKVMKLVKLLKLLQVKISKEYMLIINNIIKN